MFTSALIVFRESLEAALFIGIVAAGTRQLVGLRLQFDEFLPMSRLPLAGRDSVPGNNDQQDSRD